MISADRQTQREPESPERKLGDGDGPSKPDITRPTVPNELLKRMKNVDPDQAKKYRQRSGQ
ncbi:MAG: ubiquitin-like protein UBact [Armatimonadetes bacterium]|jgi:hypothetical protein|nr:ubiquitin-like protein UBact [Armatimonadota bacterium]